MSVTVKIDKVGPLAHLVEHLICNEEVTSSNLVGSTKRNVCEIRNAGRFLQSKKRAVCPDSALGGADEIPKFPPIA